MVPFKFILIVQNNSEIFKSISYRYKFLVGARDPSLDVIKIVERDVIGYDSISVSTDTTV